MTWVQHIMDFPEVQHADEIILYAGDMKHDSAILTIQENISLFENKKIKFREFSRKQIPIS